MEVYKGKLVIKGDYSKEGILLSMEELFVFRRRIHTFAPPREVAQAGSAPGLGPGGRRFESCLPDVKSFTAM